MDFPTAFRTLVRFSQIPAFKMNNYIVSSPLFTSKKIILKLNIFVFFLKQRIMYLFKVKFIHINIYYFVVNNFERECFSNGV